MIMCCSQFWDVQFSHPPQSKASSGAHSLSLLNRERRDNLHLAQSSDSGSSFGFSAEFKLYAGAHDSENLGSKGMRRAMCK